MLVFFLTADYTVPLHVSSYYSRYVVMLLLLYYILFHLSFLCHVTCSAICDFTVPLLALLPYFTYCDSASFTFDFTISLLASIVLALLWP
jgi:hypothetical protein